VTNISRKHFPSTAVEKQFFEYIHVGFAHKRKFVRNNLTSAGLDPGTIAHQARAEDLKLADWLALAQL
jgi:16S rRNA A1518/A1519 N6-dimethyltransferase RsmA/KsgA/DIM1 with predicted DNA glycosylase/AP lyase activity